MSGFLNAIVLPPAESGDEIEILSPSCTESPAVGVSMKLKSPLASVSNSLLVPGAVLGKVSV